MKNFLEDLSLYLKIEKDLVQLVYLAVYRLEKRGFPIRKYGKQKDEQLTHSCELLTYFNDQHLTNPYVVQEDNLYFKDLEEGTLNSEKVIISLLWLNEDCCTKESPRNEENKEDNFFQNELFFVVDNNSIIINFNGEIYTIKEWYKVKNTLLKKINKI